MESIEKIFKKTSWLSLLESIIFAIIGAIMIGKPEEISQTFFFILGSIFIVVGVDKIINYFATKGKYDFYHYDLIYGLMACILGIVTIFHAGAISSVFRIMIGIWILYNALLRMRTSMKLKACNLNVWIYSLPLAIIMFLCGFYITFHAGAIIVTIGVIMIVYSVIDIIENIILMENVKKYDRKGDQT